MIDVIIPCFNAKKYLRDAVNSIKNQTIKVNKIIIVDDGSTDGSYEFAKNIDGVYCLKQENAGAGTARNLGLKNSDAEYIYFLDADDIAESNAIESLYEEFQNNEGLEAVFGQSVEFISTELTPEEKMRKKFNPEARFGILPGCALIKRRTFERIGYFDTSLRTGETVAWLAKFRDMGLKYSNIDKIVLKRRIHMTNTGVVNKTQERKDYLSIIRQRMQQKKN